MRTRMARAVAGLSIAAAVLSGCAPAAPAPSLTFRLWDPQVAEAYRTSLDAFEAQTGIAVEVVVVPWADYWTQLRADLAGGVADDVFWTNAANVAEYAGAGVITPVGATQRSAQEAGWAASVVGQYTLDGELWGVPQITDPGIAMVVNDELLAAAGLTPADVADLAWDPAAGDDTLRRTARALTADAEGRRPGEAGFAADRLRQYGYGASNDLNAILLPFLGSNGAAWQDGDEFVFASPEGTAAIGYVADLIGVSLVAPNAADTNPPAGGDFVRDQFLRGRVALFQTGAYNLSNVQEGAGFAWSIVPMPRGPAGRISVTNGIVAAASASSDAPAAQARLLEWLGSAEGQRAIGASGSALPAVTAAQQEYLDFWSDQGVDLSPMLDVLDGPTVQPPQGVRYSAAANALQPILNDVFLGRTPADTGLRAAQDAANAAFTGR